jgi:hypothetical protein
LLKGRLPNQAHALPLGIFSLSVGVSHPIGQAPKFHLGQVSGLAHICKLALKKGALPNRLTSLPISKSQ